MSSIKRIIAYWEYLKGSFPEFPMHKRIFHSIVMLSIATIIFALLRNIFFDSLAPLWLYIVLIFLQVPILYYSRFQNAFKVCYPIWIMSCYTFIIITFFLQGGFNIAIWNLILIVLFTTTLVSHRRYQIAWFVIHCCIFLSLLYVEYYHYELIVNNTVSREIFYFKIAYYSLAAFAIFQIYTNFIITNYTNKRKKLECQRAESEIRGERLKILNEQKNKLISIISHDFNTPLNNIKRYLYLMKQVEVDDATRKQLENELLLVTIDTQNLLMNLLAWSKNNMEGIQFSPEIVNVNDAIIYTKDLYRDIANEKNISLSYQIDNDVHVMGNYEMIDIIIRNFISNAIKFTAEGGKVIVSAIREANLYKLVVADNGVGFSESQLQKLFVSTVDSTPGTRHEKGAGIGLSIAKEFVEMMNGSIGFTSNPGKGTEFFIYLPAVDYKEEEEL